MVWIYLNYIRLRKSIFDGKVGIAPLIMVSYSGYTYL